jgi:hypothetical protein
MNVSALTVFLSRIHSIFGTKASRVKRTKYHPGKDLISINA